MSLAPDDKQRTTTNSASHNLRTIDPESVQFHPTLRFVNRTRRFSLPIPDLGDAAEPLVFPASSDRAGQAIKALKDGTPERGIVFYNQTDGIWQGVRANGEGVLVFNDIEPDTAKALMQKVQSYNKDVEALNLDELKSILEFAQLTLDISDIYNGRRSSMESGTLPEESMPVPIGLDGQARNDFGYRVVNKEAIHRAALETEGFILNDKRAQRYSQGAVILTNERHIWCVDSEVFQQNFKKLVNGQELPLGKLEQEFA